MLAQSGQKYQRYNIIPNFKNEVEVNKIYFHNKKSMFIFVKSKFIFVKSKSIFVKSKSMKSIFRVK